MSEQQQANPITVIIDTREQSPLAFSHFVTVSRATVHAGDYSIAGYEHCVSIERKSHADAWGSVYTAASRRRLARVLATLGDMNRAGGLGLVAISCTRDQMLTPPSPHHDRRQARRILSQWESLCGWHGVPILWGAGASEVEGAMRGWLAEKAKGEEGAA